jgi:hypothetical protein
MDEELPLMAWPDVPRLCFGPGEPGQLNACVGWVQSQHHKMFGYVEGYRKAAAALFESAVETGTSPDYLVFPIAFLWRQHLELALKDIIATGRELAGEPRGYPSGHRLLDLWTAAKPIISQCGDPAAPELANVEDNIREFQNIDPGADGFRYPLNVKQTARSMPNAPDYVNLRVLHEGMEALANFLSAVRSELGVRLDYAMEMEAQIARAYDGESLG